MTIEPFLSGPLVISTLETPDGGLIGMTHVPGRSGADARGRVWRRVLSDDLAAIVDWRASMMLTLIERPEFSRLGVPELEQAVAANGIPWRHFPIADMMPPQEYADRRLRQLLDDAEAVLARGERVLIHCAAGMGRTGTMAALLLIDGFGVDPADAVRQVRAARPGTIESDEQLRFLDARAQGSG